MLKGILLVLFVSLAIVSTAQLHTQIVGDSVRVKTNDQQRLSIWPNGVVNIAASDTTERPVFRFYPNGDFSAGTNNDYTFGQNDKKNGIRFNKKLGILEVGVSNDIDTSMNVSQGSFQTSGLIVNSDESNTILSPMISSIISGDNIYVDSNTALNWSIIAGEQHVLHAGPAKSIVTGYGHYTGKYFEASLLTGISNRLDSTTSTSIISGYLNRDLDTTYTSLISGGFNRFSGNFQFLSGVNLRSQNFAATTLGAANVEFSSLSPVKAYPPAQLGSYPLLAIGNSNNYNTIRSNAFTLLYNGRTQINTTGHTTALTESDVTPKAAFEVVSTNSGILIPRLTDSLRDEIVSGDLHNGLMIYNTSINSFQYYNGTVWKTLGEGSSGSDAVQTLSDGSTITWDIANGNNAEVTLAGTGRTLSISNPVEGQTYKVKILQDGTGARTINTWPSGTLWPGGIPPTLSTTPSAIDLVTFYYDGTNYYGDHKLLYKPTPAGVYIYYVDAKNGPSSTTHELKNVPAGALLVLTNSAGSSQSNTLSVFSSPTLTWTKRVDAQGSNSGDAEIYTAVFTAGGNINVTSNWGSQDQASVCYVIRNQETTLGGATADEDGEDDPSVDITTTRANSIIIAVTSDWNAVGSAVSYRNSPTQTQYSFFHSSGTFYHYYKEAPTTTTYTMGYTQASTQSGGTALIEIRGN